MKLNPDDPKTAAMLEGITLFIVEQVRDATTPLKEEITKLKDRRAEIEGKGVEYSGTFQRAVQYRRGQMVTHDGSLWAAINDTEPNEIPGESSRWQLAVKRGSDAPRLPTNHSGKQR
jgi:hypothetical protein